MTKVTILAQKAMHVNNLTGFIRKTIHKAKGVAFEVSVTPFGNIQISPDGGAPREFFAGRPASPIGKRMVLGTFTHESMTQQARAIEKRMSSLPAGNARLLLRLHPKGITLGVKSKKVKRSA